MGCKKTDYSPLTGDVATLNIINAVVGSPNLVPNLNPTDGKSQAPLQWYANGVKIGYGGTQTITGYQGLVPISLSTITDTLIPVWTGRLNLSVNTMNSFFLTGTDTAHVDTLFTTDTPNIYAQSDSSVGIRFINLSAARNAVSVVIHGNTGTPEVPTLAYKGVTSFRTYAANWSAVNITFEFHDLSTNQLLASYAVSGLSNGAGKNTATNTWRYKNVTIVLAGNTSSYKTILVKNY